MKSILLFTILAVVTLSACTLAFDSQANGDENLDFVREDVVPGLVGTQPLFGIVAGYVVNDDLPCHRIYATIKSCRNRRTHL